MLAIFGNLKKIVYFCKVYFFEGNSMKKTILTFLLLFAANLCFAQKLNQYKYIICDDPNLELYNWDRYNDFVLALRSKGFIYADKVTPEMRSIPRDQIVMCRIREWHTGWAAKCSVMFYDTNYQTIIEFKGTWAEDYHFNAAWKSVIKKINKYPYKFTPIKHPIDNTKTISNVIYMQKKDGVYWIDSKVNDIPMKFIFDTGATNVCISRTEALLMIKNGSLTEDDMIGLSTSQIADGSITTGTRIILRKIVIGSYTLRNIEAIVVDNENAPLLLGQSALSMLGKLQIDFKNSTITVLQ